MTHSTPAQVPDPRTAALGGRLRSARQARGESVRGLARRIGCSASLLSQIELGRSAPSVGVLYSLAGALEVSTDFLLRPGTAADPAGGGGPGATGRPSGTPDIPASDGLRSLRRLPPSYPAQIQRADGRRALDFGNGVRWERLTTVSDAQVDFLEIVYEPGGTSDEDGHGAGHEGFEYGVVTEGELTVQVGDEECVLGVGDSISFDSRTPHVFGNTGTVTARAIWFVVHDTLPGKR
ncbi:helix-turn-helix domain-containing protein [Streptomyces uncialis]|uniref:helix-turn-helix domain-containing protein n=1 Tax=Streptomyces uncialis TaxID=1048205 RepID=UPI00365B9494